MKQVKISMGRANWKMIGYVASALLAAACVDQTLLDALPPWARHVALYIILAINTAKAFNSTYRARAEADTAPAA